MTGFFTEEQLDRMNFKSLANPLPKPWNGHHLFALLTCVCDWAIKNEDMTPAECKQLVVDWYCGAPVSEVDESLSDWKGNEQFRLAYEFMVFMHDQPERVQEAIKAIENGWKPGDPK